NQAAVGSEEHVQDEFSDFISAAAHDLQSPIHGIKGYLDLLSSRCGTVLDEPAHTYIDSVLEATSRLQSLIDSMVTYSNAGLGDTKAVDCNQAFETVS